MVRWGMIGCGDVAEVKSGPALQKARESSLVAVMRRNGPLAADYARRHGVDRWYDDADQLIADPLVDAVYVATPPGSHLTYALKACAAGKPAYIEKPMARHHAECVRMVEAFAAANVPLFVAYYRRALDRFIKAKDLVDSGAVGPITGVTYRYAAAHQDVSRDNLPWRVVPTESGGGLFLDLGSHTLDIIDFILGPLSSIQGHAMNVSTPHDVEDAVAMTFVVGGAPAAAHWTFASREGIDALEISGTQGMIALSTFGNGPVTLRTATGEQTFALPNPPHIQQPLIQTIVDQLNGHGACPSTGTTAARTSAVMDQVLSGYYGGRHDSFWLRPQSWPGHRCP